MYLKDTILSSVPCISNIGIAALLMYSAPRMTRPHRRMSALRVCSQKRVKALVCSVAGRAEVGLEEEEESFSKGKGVQDLGD